MTLLERCAQVQQELIRIESLTSASKDAERDRSRHDEIRPLRIGLEDALAREKALSQAGVSFVALTSPPKLFSAFEEYRRSLTSKRRQKGMLTGHSRQP